ncbi:MAG: hypothetical protein M3186_09875 [Actinomycetota bacterium]|nr:hypothetical protein [Actinomycetota bacterium]
MENGAGTSVRKLNVFDGLALLIALGLSGVGFLFGFIGSGETGATTSADLTVTPDNATRQLAPGATNKFPVYISNTNDYGVRVASISAGTSKATPGGCPAGTVTSAPLESPAGFISPNGIRTYDLEVTMAPNADPKCKDQSFTVPLTVTLASAAADR